MTQNNSAPKSISFNDMILNDLIKEQVSGKTDFDIFEIISGIKVEEDYTKIKDWAIKFKICTEHQFKEALKKHANFAILGGYANCGVELVDLYLKKMEAGINYRKEVIKFNEKDEELTKLLIKKNNIEQDEKNSESFRKEHSRRLQEEIDCNKRDMTINDIARKIRLTGQKLGLHVPARDIEDALEEWVLQEKSKRLAEIFKSISYASGGIKGPRANYEWVELSSSMFESSEDNDLSIPAKIAVIKKFIWQVKRKIRGIHIENHMMPILIGGQGTGKSTLLSKILEPIEELSANTDFKQITDDRYIDLWSNFALKTDEMGWASRSDIDTVKNLVTTNSVNRRFMRTNSSVPVKQNATFIGASNRELNQIIRDESGMRRFVGVKIRRDPDWKRMNKLNMSNLWRSVDEEAEDPTIPYMDEIRAYQESQRVETACEQWMNSLPDNFSTKSTPGFDLYPIYKEWESNHYSKRKMDYDEWEAEFCRLISEPNSQYPFILIDTGVAKNFMFISERCTNRTGNLMNKKEQINNIRLERNREFAQFKLESAQDYVDMVDKTFDCSNDYDVKEYLAYIEKSKEGSEEQEEQDSNTNENNEESVEVETKTTVTTTQVKETKSYDERRSSVFDTINALKAKYDKKNTGDLNIQNKEISNKKEDKDKN